MASSGFIILVAVLSIALLLTLILYFKVQEVFALLLTSVVAGLAVGMSPAEVYATIELGMGDTLGFLAVVIAIGTMFGQIIETTGGAQVIADTIFNKVKEKYIVIALAFIGMLVAIPIYMEVAFVIFAPIIYSFAKKTGKSLLKYMMPFTAGVVVSYSTIPPAAGAMAGVTGMDAEVGLVIMFSLIAAVPAILIGGPLYGNWISSRIYTVPPATYEAYENELENKESMINISETRRAPDFGSVIALFLLPLVLMIGKGIGDLFLPEGNMLRSILTLLGHPFGALMIVLLIAIYVFGIKSSYTKKEVGQICSNALAPAGMIILIAGAGGAFGEVLVATGVGDVIAEYANYIGLPVLALAYVMAVFIRIAQGSGTVAIITASTLMAPIVQSMPEVSSAYVALIVSTIGFGAITTSHLNDSGYWLVLRYFNMDEIQTLKTYTAQTTIISVVGFLSCLFMSLFI